jgi:shikimate dehydrogenase
VRRCAVLGSPIAHSLSPVLHRAGYDELGLLDCVYGAYEVTEDELAGFLAGLDQTWRGLSLTMPLKRAVVPLLDEMSERAAQAQAANTVVLEGGRRIGHNTDIPGAANALRERTGAPVHSAMVLGGGATAASVLLALADLGCTTAMLVVRDPKRAGETLDAVARHPAPPAVEVTTFD